MLGKRAYAFEITKALDGQTIQLGNADYNADVGTADNGGTLIDTGEGGIVSIAFGDRSGDKSYSTDPTGIASNESPIPCALIPSPCRTTALSAALRSPK